MAYSLDDSWDSWTLVVRAGNACFGLYVRCGIWAKRNGTDGYVPDEIAAAYGSPEQTRKLVTVELWTPEAGGYLDLYFHLRNPTAEADRSRLKAAADRQARWREREHSRRSKPKKPVTRYETHNMDARNALQDALVTAPLPPLKGGRTARPATAGAARGPDCPRHLGQSIDNCGPCRSESLGGLDE